MQHEKREELIFCFVFRSQPSLFISFLLSYIYRMLCIVFFSTNVFSCFHCFHITGYICKNADVSFVSLIVYFIPVFFSSFFPLWRKSFLPFHSTWGPRFSSFIFSRHYTSSITIIISRCHVLRKKNRNYSKGKKRNPDNLYNFLLWRTRKSRGIFPGKTTFCCKASPTIH